MNVCYLHIGAPKTGTSAIQDFLLTNQDYMQANGFIYPNPGLHETDRQANDGNSKSLLKAILHSDHDLAAELNGTLMSLLKSNNVILSAEDLFNRAYENGFDIIRRIFKDVKVKVILYVRLQSEIFESAIKQRIRNHFKIDYDVPQEFYRKFNWSDCADLWAGEFGIDNIIVRNYKSHLSKTSIEFDFLDSIGLCSEDSRLVLNKKPVNQTLSGVQLEFMRMLNGASLDAVVFNKLKLHVIESFVSELAVPEWKLGLEDRERIDQYFNQSNEKLFNVYGVALK